MMDMRTTRSSFLVMGVPLKHVVGSTRQSRTIIIILELASVAGAEAASRCPSRHGRGGSAMPTAPGGTITGDRRLMWRDDAQGRTGRCGLARPHLHRLSQDEQHRYGIRDVTRSFCLLPLRTYYLAPRRPIDGDCFDCSAT